jgi:uncharacterized membrane protein
MMRPRWLIVGLVASVVLNLFLIGAGSGILGLGLRMARENAGARPAALFWATQGMSQPARHDTRRMMLGLRDQVRPDIERSRAMRTQAWSALGAAAPDPAAIKQTLAQSRQIDVAVRTRVEEAIVDHVAALAPADRAAYAAGMSRELSAPARR